MLERFFYGLLSPLAALLSPGSHFTKLRELLRRYGIYALAAIYIGAWFTASLLAFILILLVEAFRSAESLSIVGLATAPFRAAFYSIIFPVVPAFIDAILIALVVLPFPRERPIYDVFAIRASSLLPYTLRVVHLELSGTLSLKTLLAATGGFGLLMLVIGALLTGYGLRRTLGAPAIAALVGGFTPLLYKLVLGFL